MILFNLMFFKDNSNCIGSLNVNSSYVAGDAKKPYKLIKKSTGLAYILKNSDFVSGSKYNLAERNFVKQSIWQKFFNNLWEQEVFLSTNSKVLNKYNVELNSLNVNQGQNIQKHLVSKFSRSLFDISIQSSLSSEISTSNNSFYSIEYLWSKVLKIQLLSINHLLQKNAYYENLRRVQNILDEKINLNYLPLFTISNNLGQMVISEPPTDLNISRYVRSYASVTNQNSNLYHGFFFTNYEDAQEYMLYIQKYYNLDNKKLKIFTCNFSTYYKIMERFSHGVYFKLVPDLKEVSELIKKYRYHNNISFHKKQKYNRTSFQGQPLYFVKNSKYNLHKRYKYNLLFTNYNDALLFCNRQESKITNSGLKKPNLVVYNLENFIKDQFTFKTKNQNTFLVVPSKASYMFMKKNEMTESNQSFHMHFAETISYIKLWSKRIFWSLTSRKP